MCASDVQSPSAHMTDHKTSIRDVRPHPHCKKGIEPGTTRYKTAMENAAVILAKGETGASAEEKDKLVELWDNIYYEDALLRLIKYHGMEAKEPVTTKKAAIAELVKQWRGLLDEETWTAVTLSEAEMVDSPHLAGEGEGEQRPVDPDNHRRNRGNPPAGSASRSRSRPPRSRSRTPPRRSRSRSRTAPPRRS